MEINADNGIVTLKKYNLQLRKGMLLEDLQQTEFYKKYTNGMRDVKTGYFWYYFKAINVDGY